MRKLLIYAFIFFQIMIIVSLIKGVQLAIHARSRVTDLEEKKAKLVEEQKRLKDELAYVESEYYVEKVARDELHLAKPGETVVIIPESERVAEPEKDGEREKQEIPNYLKWWKVFTGQ